MEPIHYSMIFTSEDIIACMLTYAGPDITDFIKSPIQSHILSFTKTEYLDLNKKIEGLAYIISLSCNHSLGFVCKDYITPHHSMISEMGQ